MSLVEAALKKIQDSQGKPPRPLATAAQRVQRADVGALVPPASPSPGAAPAPSRSGKRIRIDRAALRAAGLFPPEHQERQLADQYRQIKRPLIANALGRGESKIANNHLIMTASALPGEGKTFTSMNLAHSMAVEKDISVLLVDADVAKPHISRLLGVDDEPGLLDALTDESIDVESLIIGTDLPNLSILPAGRRSETATELLASSSMERLAARIGAYAPHRIALLDSPPLLLTSESRVLASIVGQIVLVVRAGSTPQQAVLDAISHIGQDRCIGVVLNQSAAAESTGHHYYGYGDHGRENEPA